MIMDPGNYKNWQELYDDLDGHETFVSADSGSVYTGEEIQDRLEESINRVRAGANPESASNMMPRIEDQDGNYWMRDLVEQEWYDFLTDADGYFDHGVFREHQTTQTNLLPHQGWKLRVTAYDDEARDVTRSVLPYLQDEGIAHKVVRDSDRLQGLGGGQEGKFITIYPEIDAHKIDDVTLNGEQLFKKASGPQKRIAEEQNIESINSNLYNATTIIQDLEELLKHSEPGLDNGPSISGHNGEEKQYKNSRIHFRYGEFGGTAQVLHPEKEEPEEVRDGLIGPNGEVVGGSYEGDKLSQVLEQPVKTGFLSDVRQRFNDAL